MKICSIARNVVSKETANIGRDYNIQKPLGNPISPQDC
jgi:hypothetical protein